MQLFFSRYEFKYVVPIYLINVFRNYLLGCMDLDGRCIGGKPYEVASLYFDNFQKKIFLEKIWGEKSKKKFRLRSYGDGIVFAEIKKKLDQQIFKERNLFEGKWAEESENLKEFNFYRRKYCLEPKILVNYKRLAFYDKAHDFRLTIDSDIRGKKAKDLSTDGLEQIDFNSRYFIMELKFQKTIPYYIHRLIKNYNLQKVAISKYVLITKKIKLC